MYGENTCKFGKIALCQVLGWNSSGNYPITAFEGVLLDYMLFLPFQNIKNMIK